MVEPTTLAVGEAGHVEFGGILGGAGDLRNSVDAGRRACRCKMSWRCSRDLLAGLQLRGAPRGLGKRADDGPPCQIDFERVVPETLGIVQREIGRLANAVSSAALPRSAASASSLRQGLWATPPSAKRASLIVPPSSSRPTATDTSANA